MPRAGKRKISGDTQVLPEAVAQVAEPLAAEAVPSAVNTESKESIHTPKISIKETLTAHTAHMETVIHDTLDQHVAKMKHNMHDTLLVSAAELEAKVAERLCNYSAEMDDQMTNAVEEYGKKMEMIYKHVKDTETRINESLFMNSIKLERMMKDMEVPAPDTNQKSFLYGMLTGGFAVACSSVFAYFLQSKKFI
jgi:gas vesicle protein